MVVLQYAETHSLPAGDVLCGFNIIRIVRYASLKNDPRLFVQRIIGDAVPFNVVAVLRQFLDGILVQPSPRLMPELNGANLGV